MKLDFMAIGLSIKLESRIYDAICRKFFRPQDPGYCPEAAAIAGCTVESIRKIYPEVVQWAEETVAMVYYEE